jgi:hypothetical protein
LDAARAAIEDRKIAFRVIDINRRGNVLSRIESVWRSSYELPGARVDAEDVRDKYERLVRQHETVRHELEQAESVWDDPNEDLRLDAVQKVESALQRFVDVAKGLTLLLASIGDAA